jgi:hypothetical protein
VEFYWILTERDGTVTYIRPGRDVDTVKRRWNNGEPIHTSTRSIPAQQIRSFAKSDRLYTEQRLLEDAASAFNEPLESETGIVCRWVYKPVTQQKYRQHYEAIPSYRPLRYEDGMVMVAFKCPIHQIDKQKVSLCSEEEILQLTRY